MRIPLPIKKWICLPGRLPLLRWSSGFFTCATLVLLIVGTRYFAVYRFTMEPLGILYPLVAFVSHFGSVMLLAGLTALPLIVLFPWRKLIVPCCVLTVSAIITLVLLDSQIYTAHRFHFSLLTVRILGWKTWGFGILYFVITCVFNSFLAAITWKRHIVLGKKSGLAISVPALILLLLFTHGTHIWADAAGYVPVTGFTTTLPMFYPSTGKKQLVKLGIVDLSKRGGASGRGVTGSKLHYPVRPLAFGNCRPNILLIGIDAMRRDQLTPERSPRCAGFARESATIFTDHWSGGNSTKMGLFSLFYGIPPTYQHYFESTKRTPVLVDRLLECGYEMGIFTSYKLYRPAGLDVTAFADVKNLRLETIIPGPKVSYRNDSAITDQWKAWLDQKTPGKPFFGFLFYDALCDRTYPASREPRADVREFAGKKGEKRARYETSMAYIDSLIGAVIDDCNSRGILDSMVVIITSDHGEEFDDNGLGFEGHGSAYSDHQLRVPLVVRWPGRGADTVEKRTSHNDLVATLLCRGLGCQNPPEDYCSGFDLFSDRQWEWLIAGSYYNFAIIEPQIVTVQYPGGYYEMRDHHYLPVKGGAISPNVAAALGEMGRFHKK